MNSLKISKRLEAAASFARQGVRIADIGTDHAYLPIYLYTNGVVRGGVAADINQGPVERARINLRRYGADSAVCTLCTDGLHGVEEYSPDDIFILGMGGELIVKILSEAEWITSGHRLVLQPMTHPEILRKYLYSSGFSIIDEKLVEEDKIYQIICAEYTGEKREADRWELVFGAINIKRGGELFESLLTRTRKVYAERIKGKALSGADAYEEISFVEGIDLLLKGEQK